MQNMMHFNNRTTKPFCYNKTPSKVVSIPVHFVVSERNRNDSAMVIQRVARGYLVRKSLKKMLKMKVELEEIDNKVNAEETVKMMKKEQKERIRIGETIMNLLLRLDSVSVFHFSALTELRKLLIKRAIFLQEFVDQIQTLGPACEVEDFEGKCDGVEENCLENEAGEKMEFSVNEDVGEDCLMKVKEEKGQDEDEKEEDKEESVGSSFEEDGVDVKEEESRIVIGCEDEEEENREMLRRMMDDNVKMMYMMTQLVDRNEKQTSLLTSLTQRVEQLERAFTCEKLKKKNNRSRHVVAKHRYNGCT